MKKANYKWIYSITGLIMLVGFLGMVYNVFLLCYNVEPMRAAKALAFWILMQIFRSLNKAAIKLQEKEDQDV